MKAWLSQKGISYTEKDVSRDQAAAYEMIRKSGQQGVPVIDIDDQVVVGFDRRRLETILAASTAKPTLGAAVADAERILTLKRLAPMRGAYIGRVVAGSLASKLSLRIGDVITELAGRTITSAEDVIQTMRLLERGQVLTVTYVRDGSTHQASVQA